MAANGTERLIEWIREREAIRLRREKGWPSGAPEGLKELGSKEVWTIDPILAEFRFCNVSREDDRVTKWIDENWRSPNESDDDLWFAMVVARFINWPETLDAIGYPCPWKPNHFLETMDKIKAAGRKVYTGAYMVRAGGTEGKPIYQEREVFTPMWEDRERLRPKVGDTLNSYHMLLGQFHGLGSFMAAQIVADLKYVEPLSLASDWVYFAASGPGSRRGLNRVLERPVDAAWTEEGWRQSHRRLFDDVAAPVAAILPGKRFHAQDLQNCLCEFDKYERVRLGQGKPRAKFVSHGG